MEEEKGTKREERDSKLNNGRKRTTMEKNERERKKGVKRGEREVRGTNGEGGEGRRQGRPMW